MDDELRRAIKIAEQDLQACYSDEGIIAGTHHFTDYWARDGYFAALGAVANGDREIVEKMLKLFFKFQRGDGLIPYRVMRGPITLGKYLGKPKFYKNPRPTYKLRSWGPEVLDGTTLTLLFTAILRDKKYIPQIKKSLEYLKKRERNGLLFDGVMSEWNDCTLKWGNLLYSNVIYWYMYKNLSSWAKKFDHNWANNLESKTQDIALCLRSRLWTGKYFADWYDYKRQEYFYPFGNCLAVAWGLTEQKETRSILKKCESVKINFSLETNSPKYPFWRIDLFQRLIGVGDYQNKGTLWWQPVTSYIAALKKAGLKKELSKYEKIISEKIIKDEGVYECYERNGKPVNRFFYKSEHPFAWGSGMIIWSMKS